MKMLDSAKADVGFTDNFSIRVEGLWVIIRYRGKDIQRTHLEAFGVAYADYQVYLGEMQGKSVEVEDPDGIFEDTPLVNVTEVVKFIDCYKAMQKKYTGRCGVYPVPNPDKASKPSVDKNWKAFVSATAQCKQAELYPNEYLDMLVSHYTRRAGHGGGQVALPFPNQLQGQWAQNVIIEETARRNSRTVPNFVRATRLASTNSRLKLDDDTAYLEARARIKVKKHTEFDIEYIKARLTQTFGQPKDWILAVEKDFKAEQAKVAQAQIVKEDVSNG